MARAQRDRTPAVVGDSHEQSPERGETGGVDPLDLAAPAPVTNSHATPLAGVKDIQKALRPRIERELCAVGGTLRRKVEAEYQSELVEKHRELKRRHQEQRQQLDRALRELDDVDPPRKRARV